MFVAMPVCAGKEYYFMGVLDALLAQDFPAERLHFHCIFDGEPRMARMMWEAFAKEAEDAGSWTSEQIVRIQERHENRFVNVAVLCEAARRTFLEGGHEWLWWTECDCPPPPSALAELLALELPMATATVTDRASGTHLNHQEEPGVVGHPKAWRRDAEPREIHVSGLSCCVMHRDIMERVGWDDDWHRDPLGHGGQDQYIQARIREELGVAMTIHPQVLVPHVDAHPREWATVLHYEPRWNGAGLVVERVECDWRECPGAWRPRRRPWRFNRRWRNYRPPEVVPEEWREMVLQNYPHCMTHDGPDLPAGIDETDHELLLPGEACHIGGMYVEIDERGEPTTAPYGLWPGERAADGCAAHDLVDIEEV